MDRRTQEEFWNYIKQSPSLLVPAWVIIGLIGIVFSFFSTFILPVDTFYRILFASPEQKEQIKIILKEKTELKETEPSLAISEPQKYPDRANVVRPEIKQQNNTSDFKLDNLSTKKSNSSSENFQSNKNLAAGNIDDFPLPEDSNWNFCTEIRKRDGLYYLFFEAELDDIKIHTFCKGVIKIESKFQEIGRDKGVIINYKNNYIHPIISTNGKKDKLTESDYWTLSEGAVKHIFSFDGLTLYINIKKCDIEKKCTADGFVKKTGWFIK